MGVGGQFAEILYRLILNLKTFFSDLHSRTPTFALSIQERNRLAITIKFICFSSLKSLCIVPKDSDKTSPSKRQINLNIPRN